MKPVIMLMMMALSLLLAGCAGLQTAQDMVCDPPADVLAVVNAGAPIVATVINMAVPGSAAFISAANAQGVINSIQSGICITVTQLNNLIAFFQSKEAHVAGARAMVKPLDVTPLVKWRDRK